MSRYTIRYGLFMWLFIIFSISIFAQNDAVPRFENSPCAIEVPKGENPVCGYLIVPENRTAASTRTIRLPIIILKSDSPSPRPDPVLRTLGGPGASSLKMVRGRRSSPWLRDRDYIIFEQRGTRYAQPSLECPEVDESNISSAKKRLDQSATKKNVIAAAKTCFERLKNSGFDLSGYNSAESAADIADLRRVLKLDEINLYGVSYSARLTLDVMRYHPEGIRSVVLESTLPPEVNYDEVGVDAIERSLTELFTSCGKDSACSKAYPELEREFYQVVARLNREPLVVPAKAPNSNETFDIRLTGDDFATWIVDYLFSNEPAATAEAPFVIHQAFNNNYVEQFRRYAGDKLSGSFYSWGMRFSVWCSEERKFENAARIRAQSIKYPGLHGYEVMALPDICSVWNVAPAKSVANQPVLSRIPALVIGAQYDAYTEPEWGRKVSARLKNSFFVEIPWAGHGPAFSVPCVGTMIADFFDDPAKAPDAGCIVTTRSQFRFLIKEK